MTNYKSKSIVFNDMNKKSKKGNFSYSVYNKGNFKKFCELEVNLNVKSIDKKDLPSKLSEGTCKFIDLFRRKTANENDEWNFYIDYEREEIIHCFHGSSTSVKGNIHSELMKNRKILSIHNHPLGTYSAPSPQNFEILEHEFENYEIICAENEYWIIESNDAYDKSYVETFKANVENIFQDAIIKSTTKNYDSNKVYSKKLYEYINNLKNNIKLIKKEYK